MAAATALVAAAVFGAALADTVAPDGPGAEQASLMAIAAHEQQGCRVRRAAAARWDLGRPRRRSGPPLQRRAAATRCLAALAYMSFVAWPCMCRHSGQRPPAAYLQAPMMAALRRRIAWRWAGAIMRTTPPFA